MSRSPQQQDALRAKDAAEIKPLLELCRAGRLFEVQAWIAAGKPINSPTNGKRRIDSPLEQSIDSGFHSLVEVLLKGGAEIGGNDYRSPMNRALGARRVDIVKLLVEHGFKASEVDLREVFDTWDADLVEYFIDRGADAETGRPLAYALCNRIHTALRIFKKYRSKFSSFQEQIDIALRHHCKDGNLKWVSLMLWAGADPLSKGVDEWNSDRDDEFGSNAVVLAILYKHYDILSLKKMQFAPDHPEAFEVAGYACEGKGLEILESLVRGGLKVNDQPNGGCSILQRLLCRMGWEARLYEWRGWTHGLPVDNQTTRDQLEAFHTLVEYGAKWIPDGVPEVNDVRKSLLKLKPEYTVEVVGILVQFQGATRQNLDALLRPKSIVTHVDRFLPRIAKLLESAGSNGEHS